MATSMKNVRIKVDLHEISTTKDILCGTSWYLVDTSALATIADLKKDVITRYLRNASDVFETLTDVHITLDGILVPDWSGVNILRENDIIRFSFSEVDVKYADKKQKRKEKKKNKDQGTKTPDKFTENHSSGHVKKKNKKRKAEVFIDEGSQFSSKKKVKTQHKNIKSGEKTEVVANESTNKVHNNLEKKQPGASRKPVQNTSTSSSSSDSSETESQVGVSHANKFDGKKDRVRMPEQDSGLQKKEIASKVRLEESNSNDSELDNKSRPPNKNTVKNNVAVGHRDGITKKHNVTESVSDSSDSSDSDSEIGVIVVDNIAPSQIVVQQGVSSKNNSFHEDRERERSCKEGNKVEVMDTNPCSTDQENVGLNSIDSTEAMNKQSREDGEQMNTKPGAEATHKRRRGKRVRSRKKKDTSASGQICRTAPLADGVKNVGFSLVDVNDERIVSVSPVTSGVSHNALGSRNNFHATMYNKSIKYNGDNTKHIKFGSDEEKSVDDEVKSNDVGSTPVLNDTQISFNKCTPRLGEQNEASPTGRAQCETKVIQSKCELLSGAQVFTRTRHKKRGSFPLSKAQALSDQLTNKSFTFQNTEGGELMKKQKEPPSDSLQHTESSVVTKPTPDKTAVEVKNYEGMPRLYGAPRIGDRIAYKVLEMSENYCPEVSAFKEAVVTSFDPQTSSVGLELTATKEKSKRGRFDCVVEGEDFVLTNTETQADTQLTLDLNSLMETRLVTEDK